MGKPLDTQSKVAGLITISEFYFLIAALLVAVFLLPTLYKYFGISLAMLLVGVFLFCLLIFLVVSNQFPENFFLNYILYKLRPQVYRSGNDKKGTRN